MTYVSDTIIAFYVLNYLQNCSPNVEFNTIKTNKTMSVTDETVQF